MDLGLLDDLTVDDVICISSFLPLAEKAKEIEELISTKFANVQEGKSTEVYRHRMESGNNGYYELEYITRKDGKLHWITNRYHSDYDLTIDKDEIFNLLSLSYRLNLNCPFDSDSRSDSLYNGAYSLISAYFERFIHSIQK